MHEEDYGILWKHNDMVSGRTEVRRSRRLVVSSIATVGNYEYGFYWYFYLDGTMQLEVKLTGIMSTMAVANGDAGDHAKMVAPGLAAPYHQHLFNVRLDIEVDGGDNAVFEVDATGAGRARHAREPLGQRVRHDGHPARVTSWPPGATSTRRAAGVGASPTAPCATASASRRPTSCCPARRRRCWPIPTRAWAGAPRSRRTTCGSRRTTPRSAGPPVTTRTSTRGGAGLPEWTAQDRPIVDTDIVVWHSFGVTHIPRPEDWPVMPVEYTGFSLVPFGFFDRNPALDVPPSADHCDG